MRDAPGTDGAQHGAFDGVSQIGLRVVKIDLGLSERDAHAHVVAALHGRKRVSK